MTHIWSNLKIYVTEAIFQNPFSFITGLNTKAIYYLFTFKQQISKFSQDTLNCFITFPNLWKLIVFCCKLWKNVAVVKNSIAVIFKWLCFYYKCFQNTTIKQYKLQNYGNCKTKEKRLKKTQQVTDQEVTTLVFQPFFIKGDFIKLKLFKSIFYLISSYP